MSDLNKVSVNGTEYTVVDTELDELSSEIDEIKSDLYNVSSDVTELQNGVSYTDVKTELTITTDTKSLKEDGTMVAFGGYSLKADVEGYEIVEFVAKNFMTNSSNPYPVTAFTDQNGNIVKMTTAGAYVNNHTYTEKVPQSAKYFYINTWSTNGTISGIIRTYSIPNTINDSLVPIKNNIVSNGLYDFLWTNRIYFWDVGTRSTDATRIGLQNVLLAKTDLKIIAESGYNVTIMIFSSSTESVATQVRSSNWVTEGVVYKDEYFLINVRKTDNSEITPSESYNAVCMQYSAIDIIDNKILPVENNLISNGLYNFKWTNRIYFWNVGTRSTDATRIGLANVLQAKTDLKITAESGYNVTVMIFSSGTESLNTQVRFSNWVTEGIVYKDEYFLINVRKTDNTAITPSESHNAVCMQYNVSNGTVLHPSGIKTEVLTEQIGVLTKFQSFCIYDNKYYSTDGDNISVQDSDFTAISTTALSVGHGNSFQLGSGNKGYISGWEDQKVYVIDMDNITVDSVITLPTTGYTTVAIDDLNKIAYIFQRSTNPNSVTNYNFITYDYENQQVINTKVLSNPFGAMQAVDFYNGKIFVAYGLGTSAVPSGLVVYNTNGDVLAEYDLDILASLEPEGVCFNRTDKTLLISDVNKKVYTVM